MYDNLKNQLVLLRQRIPIGLRHGQVLLENTTGNIDEAENLFKKETIVTLIEKTGVSDDAAKRHLEKNKYDIRSALRAIDEEQHSLSERILRRYQHNKLHALEHLAHATKTDLKITRDVWLSFEDLARHPPEIFCLLSIMEWLDYEGWEGLSCAVHFRLDIVLDQIDNCIFRRLRQHSEQSRR